MAKTFTSYLEAGDLHAIFIGEFESSESPELIHQFYNSALPRHERHISTLNGFEENGK